MGDNTQPGKMHSENENSTDKTDTDRRNVLKTTGVLASIPALSSLALAEDPSNESSEGNESEENKSKKGESEGDKPEYQPTVDSLKKHEVPDWYDDAKLGIFIHWGAYSVPAWSAVGGYAEWYPQGMHQENDTDNDYHNKFYGSPVPSKAEEGEQVFEYKDFIKQTDKTDAPENFEAENWNPDRWAELFDNVGAGYVIPVGEHHDGFAMWDTDITKWNAAEMGPKRDVIGELAKSVRSKGMKFGASYHRMTNFYDPRYTGFHGNPYFSDDGPEKKFLNEWRKRWQELRDKVKPDILWFDGDWSADYRFWNTPEVVANYYNLAQEGWNKSVVVNNRLGNNAPTGLADFTTPEYESYSQIIDKKWEATRGIGYSFGFNRNEEPYFYLTKEEIIQSFVDIVSKNGNLLLNVGPKKDGTIPVEQEDRLQELGEWLDTNGEAIFGTSYWVEPEEELADTELRYTTKDEHVYAILYGWPAEDIKLNNLKYINMNSDYTIELLTSHDYPAYTDELSWSSEKNGVTINLPERSSSGQQPAYVLKIQAADEGNNAFEQAAEKYEGQITYTLEEVQNDD